MSPTYKSVQCVRCAAESDPQAVADGMEPFPAGWSLTPGEITGPGHVGPQRLLCPECSLRLFGQAEIDRLTRAAHQERERQ